MKPLGLMRSLLWFGIPAAGFTLAIYGATPWMLDNGFSVFGSFSIGFIVPLTALLVASIIAYKREGHPWSQRAFSERMRLRRMTRVDWLWTLFLLVVTLGGYFGLKFTVDWLSAKPFFAPPEFLELFRTEDSFLGVPLAGSWWLVAYHGLLLVVNIFGEELWFRGTIFPRQELAFGKRTWIVHGLLYNAFHMFWKWDLIRLLPESLAYGLVAQKTRKSRTSFSTVLG
jgi:membrane protease YdiL (CAAX protease family)